MAFLIHEDSRGRRATARRLNISSGGGEVYHKPDSERSPHQRRIKPRPGRTPLQPLPKLPVKVLVFNVGVLFLNTLFVIVGFGLNYGTLLAGAAVLIGLTYVTHLLRRAWPALIKERDAVREQNFWIAMDNVIGWELPGRSPELAELEREVYGICECGECKRVADVATVLPKRFF